MQQSEYLSSWLKIIGLIVILGSLSVLVSQLHEIREYNAAVDQAKEGLDRARASTEASLAEMKDGAMREQVRQQFDRIDMRIAKRSEWESGYVLIATLLGLGCVVFSRKLGGLLADRPGRSALESR